ncbi:hypothetical protein ABNV16_14815 [Escherichia coli]|uniref:hypothetical protein n=1 Tax=Escherichia coli TaxID=562 RepID=UPI0032D8BE4D
MTSKETFTHYQPLGNSDPAHTATAPGGLSAKAPAMTPLMPDNLISLICFSLLLSNSSSSVAATSPRIWANTRLPLPFPT